MVLLETRTGSVKDGITELYPKKKNITHKMNNRKKNNKRNAPLLPKKMKKRNII
jgi:hypothetical protein